MLPPEMQVTAVQFLIEIGRWAKAELSERWKLRTSQQEKTTAVDLSDETQVQQGAQAILQQSITQMGEVEVKRVFTLIQHKRKLIFDWQRIKLFNEEEANLGRMTRSQLMLSNEDLDEKIKDTLSQIETDLHNLGLQIDKENTQ